jgi:hypothetical protein
MYSTLNKKQILISRKICYILYNAKLNLIFSGTGTPSLIKQTQKHETEV